MEARQCARPGRLSAAAVILLVASRAGPLAAQGRFPPDSVTNLKVAVRSVTSHRGLPRPRLLDEELKLVLADSGLDVALRRYRELALHYAGTGGASGPRRLTTRAGHRWHLPSRWPALFV